MHVFSCLASYDHFSLCAGPNLLSLSEDVLQIVAGCMTAREWARSGARVCQKLHRLELPRVDIDLAYTYRQTKPLHPGRPGYLQNVIMWACRRWRTCKYLRIHCPLLVTNKNAAGLPSLIMENGPVNVTMLELSAGKETNAGCLFEALLASVQIHNQLEVL